jgi:hypothetical protein
MERERFWFGTALVVVPVALLLLMITPRQDVPRGHVEGHVSVHGRPMTGGYIVFWPQDWETDLAISSIDDHGHYQADLSWPRTEAGGTTRFRVCVVPRTVRRASRPGANEVFRADVPQARRNGGRGTLVTGVAADFPRRLSDPRTSSLEVHLNTGPAWVDITL